MDTSETTSGGPTQWSPLGLWTRSSSPPSGDASDSIIVTTATSTTTTSPTINNYQQLAAKGNIEGRVGKSGAAAGRKRTRASRRAPTTMLNTDTANFRSMVQQFTGIMSGPYPYPITDPVLHSGYNFNNPISSSSSRVHRPSAMPMELQQQYQYQYQYHTVPSHHGHGHDREQQQASSLFVPESNNSIARANLEVGDDEFFTDAMYAQWMPASRPTSNPNIKVDDDFYF